MPEQLARTVIVVGAGASYEFGLPVGTTLQDQIHSLVKMKVSGSKIEPYTSNRAFYDRLPAAVGLERYNIGDLTRLAKKSLQISKGVQLTASIDNYLHGHSDDRELVAIGKYAIAQCILSAEDGCSLAYGSNGNLFRGPQNSQTQLAPHKSWIGLLTKILCAGRNFSEFCKALSSITFVCFNYDRCIERYLFGASSEIYPSSNFSFEAVAQAINIIHPYGYLGELLPESGLYGTFGKHEEANFVLKAAGNIRTFTEGMDENVTTEIGEALSSAKNAIFLGYGFVTTNDDFLFKKGPFEISTVLGTTLGISEERAAFVEDKLKENCMMKNTSFDVYQQMGSPQLRPEGCADLLHRFSHLFEVIGRT